MYSDHIVNDLNFALDGKERFASFVPTSACTLVLGRFLHGFFWFFFLMGIEKCFMKSQSGKGVAEFGDFHE